MKNHNNKLSPNGTDDEASCASEEAPMMNNTAASSLFAQLPPRRLSRNNPAPGFRAAPATPAGPKSEFVITKDEFAITKDGFFIVKSEFGIANNITSMNSITSMSSITNMDMDGGADMKDFWTCAREGGSICIEYFW